MSMLAIYIVGIFWLPCHTFFLLSSCHSHSFCNSCVINTERCCQLIPTCNCFQPSDSFSLSKRRIIKHVAYHCDTADILSLFGAWHHACGGTPHLQSSNNWELGSFFQTHEAILEASCYLIFFLFDHFTHCPPSFGRGMRAPDGVSRHRSTAVTTFAVVTTDHRHKQLTICQTNYTVTVTKIAITTTGRKQLVVCCLSEKRTNYICACLRHHWGHRGISRQRPQCRPPQPPFEAIRRHHQKDQRDIDVSGPLTFLFCHLGSCLTYQIDSNLSNPPFFRTVSVSICLVLF